MGTHTSPIPSNETERIKCLQSYRILDTAPDLRFDRIAQLAADLTNVPIAMISLVDETRQWFKARVGLDVTQTEREISFCAHAIMGEDILQVGDATQDPRFQSSPLVLCEPNIRFYAGAPLKTKEGHQLGTLLSLIHI